jgi:hypothetical protein
MKAKNIPSIASLTLEIWSIQLLTKTHTDFDSEWAEKVKKKKEWNQ